MTYPDLIGLFIEPFEELQLQYFVTGGVASVIYGDPRFTRDVDVVLALGVTDVERLRSAFDPDDFYVPPSEALSTEATRSTGGHFNLIHSRTALRADVYVTADDPLEAWAFEHRERITVGDLDVWIAPVEDDVIRKLQYYLASGSERHLRYAAVVLRVSGESVDREALGRWVATYDLRDALETAEGYDPG